jgi:hypothetical protein
MLHALALAFWAINAEPAKTATGTIGAISATQ